MKTTPFEMVFIIREKMSAIIELITGILIFIVVIILVNLFFRLIKRK